MWLTPDLPADRVELACRADFGRFCLTAQGIPIALRSRSHHLGIALLELLGSIDRLREFLGSTENPHGAIARFRRGAGGLHILTLVRVLVRSVPKGADRWERNDGHIPILLTF